MYEYTVVGLHCQLAGTNPNSPYCLVLSNSCFPSISGLPCLLFLPASSPAACYTSHAPLNAPLVLRIVDRSSGSTASVLRLSGLRQQRLPSDSSRSLSLSNSNFPLSLFLSRSFILHSCAPGSGFGNQKYPCFGLFLILAFSCRLLLPEAQLRSLLLAGFSQNCICANLGPPG